MWCFNSFTYSVLFINTTKIRILFYKPVWLGIFSGKELALRWSLREKGGSGSKKTRISHPAVLILTSGWLISITIQRLPTTTLLYNKISFKRRNSRENLKLKILFKNEAQGKTKTPELPVGNDKSEVSGNDVIGQKISFKRRI